MLRLERNECNLTLPIVEKNSGFSLGAMVLPKQFLQSHLSTGTTLYSAIPEVLNDTDKILIRSL